MHVIAFISQKGGSGKTTLATALAVAHQQAGGRAAIADLVLVPCRPSSPDLAAIGASLEVAALARAAAVVVLNAVPPRGSLAVEAADAVTGIGARVVPVTLGSKIAHVHALALGRSAQEYAPRGKAAEEMQTLYRWAFTQFHKGEERT